MHAQCTACTNRALPKFSQSQSHVVEMPKMHHRQSFVSLLLIVHVTKAGRDKKPAHTLDCPNEVQQAPRILFFTVSKDFASALVLSWAIPSPTFKFTLYYIILNYIILLLYILYIYSLYIVYSVYIYIRIYSCKYVYLFLYIILFIY